MSIKKFIQEHLNDNTDKLLLNASRYPGIDVPYAVCQISARRQIKDKLPSWFTNDDIIYPSRLSTEQCSSETTARYKQRLIIGDCICDLTGGLGIDSYYFAQKAKKVIYIERFPDYCAAATSNFHVLGINNVEIQNADAKELINTLKADTFYIDPARRADGNKRVFALTDCEPDVLQLKPILLENARRIIVKISPMADINETLRLLPETSEVHILSVKNECKELLFVLENNLFIPQNQVTIHAVNYDTNGNCQVFTFTPEEEKTAELHTTATIQKYLYEPHAALLKSGAFKLTAIRFGLQKLHRHSHLYTSDTICPDFPGRRFIVHDIFEFSGKLLKQLHKTIPQANLTTRNFNLSVADLRKRSGIREGGDIYLLATTLNNNRQVLLSCRKVNSSQP